MTGYDEHTQGELNWIDSDIRDIEALLASSSVPAYVDVQLERARLSELRTMRDCVDADESDRANHDLYSL